MSSTFQFTLPGISLVLENKTQITLQSLNCHYKADGTVMKIIGTQGSGILVDNHPLVATNNNEFDSSYWVLDLISSTFSIERNVANHVENRNDTYSHGPVACVRFRKKILKKVYEGVQDTLSSLSLKSYVDVQLSNDNSNATIVVKESSEVKSNWSIEIKDTIDIQFEGESIEILEEDSTTTLASSDGDTLKSVCFRIDSPFFILDSQLFRCNGITVASDPLGSFSILVPAIVQVREEKRISINGDLSIDVGSLDDLTKINTFFNEFDIRKKHIVKHDDVNDKSVTAMKMNIIPVTVPFIILNIQESDMQMKIDAVNLKGNGIDIQSVSLQHGKIASVTLLGIAAKHDDKRLEISIRMIDDLSYKDTFILLEPISHSKVTYDEGTIAVNLNSFNGQIITTKQVDNPTNANESSNNSLPFPIIFHANKISIKSHDKTGNHEENFEASNFAFNINSGSSHENNDNNSDDFIKLRFDEMHSDLMKLPETEFSSYFNLNKNEFRNLSLTIPQTIYVTVGHSSLLEMAGNAIFGEENKKKVMYNLPNAKMGKLHFDFSYDATFVSGKGSKLEVAAFAGTPDTLSDDLIAYYHNRVIKQVPGFIRESYLLGANIVDTTVAYGAFALSANPYTAVFGVLGLDAIVNTLDAGRKSRGADREF